jgi:hypothetical protein
MAAFLPDIHGSPTLDEPLNPTPASDPDLLASPGTGATPPAAGAAAAGTAATEASRATGSTQRPAPRAPRPDPDPATTPPPPPAPGLIDQAKSTKDAAQGLVGAHVELAKAEFADIADAAKRAAALVGIAIGAAIVAGLILTVGIPLFLGEAIFGSMGWGILLGVLLLAAIAVAGIAIALRPAVNAPIGRPFVLAAIIGLVVGVVLGLDLTNRAWAAVATAAVPGLPEAWRPVAVGVLALAIVGAVVGLVVGLASGAGGGGTIGALIAGLIAGALVGWLTAFAPGPRVGAAIGVAVGLIAWIALMGAGIARGGWNTDALKDRFWPSRTIDMTKETIEWARNRVPGSPMRPRGS